MCREAQPWVWRARFPDWHPDADLLLLEQGFHIAYIDASNLYGSPAAVALWDEFYQYCTETLGLASRVALEGASRGGLIVYNWAARNTDKVASIYLESPVTDFKSWPGGLGEGIGSEIDWQQAQEAYDLDDAGMRAYTHNPVDKLLPIALAGIPILHLIESSDEVVPPAENTAIVFERITAMGGDMRVIQNQAGPRTLHGHHFPFAYAHQVMEFIRAHSLTSPAPDRALYSLSVRDGLSNARSSFLDSGKGRVAFLGGSITYNKGWRTKLMKDLQRRFPDVDFEFIAAGIPSMGSTPGAFRLRRDVLDEGKMDMLFVEAAVNDSTNGRSNTEALRGMEGIVRQALAANPAMDVVLMHFVDPQKMALYNSGQVPAVIRQHEAVAVHYGLPSIDLAKEVTARITAGEFTWEDDFKDLHPSPFGQELYFQSISHLLDSAWQEDAWQDKSGDVVDRCLPGTPLDTFSYDGGRLLSIDRAERLHGFQRSRAWAPSDGAGTREGFVNVPMLVAEEPGASFQLDFEGRAIGLWVAAGPDAGIIEYSIDNAAPRSVDLLTQWSGHLHLPWAFVLEAELDRGPHRLTVTVRQTRNAGSTGNAVRIAHFLVSE